MLSTYKEEIFLAEAQRIGDELLSSAEVDSHGAFWQTMDFDSSDKLIWKKSADIYQGCSGIVLFLFELFEQTGISAYLDTGLKCVDWLVYNYPQHQHNVSFFTGAIGVAYVISKAYEITGESQYAEQSLEVVQASSDQLFSTSEADILSGVAGSLLGLIHIHAIIRNDKLLALIDSGIRSLINLAYPGPKGLYWERNENKIKGLCGFSHGSAGIGFVFLELGRYFQNETFFWIAEQAFAYESCFFNPKTNNWPDFRKVITYNQTYFTEGLVSYMDKDTLFFTEPRDVNAWCHGAAGVGLSRLRAFALLNKASYQHEVESALKKVEETTIRPQWSNDEIINFTLCHGICGNLDLFLEAAAFFKDNDYFSIAQKMAYKVLEHRQNTGFYVSGYCSMGGDALKEDLSLFMGNAGIGYFFLRMAAPGNVPSLLIPKLEETACAHELIRNYPMINLSIEEAHKFVLEKTFRRTLNILKYVDDERLENYFEGISNDDIDYKEQFVDFTNGLIETTTHSRQIFDILTLELTSGKIDTKINSLALLFIKKCVQSARVSKLLAVDDNAFCNFILKADSDIEIIQTCWDWSQELSEQWIANLFAEPDEYFLLLKPTVAGMKEIPVYPFVVFLLRQFKESQSVGQVIQRTEMQWLPSPIEKKLVRKKILNQIKQLIAAGILMPMNWN